MYTVDLYLRVRLRDRTNDYSVPVAYGHQEVWIPRDLFADILRRIDRLRTTPLPT